MGNAGVHAYIIFFIFLRVDVDLQAISCGGREPPHSATAPT